MNKIVSLQAENFKRIRAIEIKPNGSTVVVGGANAQGKSSVLDAIEAALGGQRHVPERPIREGEDSAKVVLELEDIVVTRRFSGSGSTLVVASKSGEARFASPQAMLDKLVGSLSFDPLAFARMEAKAQADILRKLVGLDFSQHNQERKATFDKRADVNREVKRIEAQLEKTPHFEGVGPVTTLAELAAEFQRRQQTNSANSQERAKLAALRTEHARLKTDVEAMRQRLEYLEASLSSVSESGKAQSVIVAALVDADTESVRAAI